MGLAKEIETETSEDWVTVNASMKEVIIIGNKGIEE